jgi:multiple sugar transport system permease protein
VTAGVRMGRDRRPPQRKQFKPSVALTYTLLVVGAGVFALPLIIMITTSFKSHTEINSFPPTIIPDAWLPQNYADAWNYRNTDFARWTINTLTILVLTLPGVVLTSSLCAYGFARIRFPGRNLWFGLVLASIMLPPQVLPLVVPAWFGGGALSIFLMRQFFLQIPHELDEAAIIDGASHFTIWWRIYMPLSRPVLVTVALLATLGIWNDFFGPLIYLTSPENFTLALGLNLFQGLFISRIDYIMAISTLMVLPMILLFVLAQRYIVQGFISSGLKG